VRTHSHIAPGARDEHRTDTIVQCRGVRHATSARIDPPARSVHPTARFSWDRSLPATIVGHGELYIAYKSGSFMSKTSANTCSNIHGHWETEESVVFGPGAYDSLLHDDVAQSFLRLRATERGILYVGVGGGVADPNFDALRRWVKGNLDESSRDGVDQRTASPS
jgi:hypothetical protein